MSDTLNSLLDASLDDLADLPEFGVYPAGSHKVRITSLENKDINGHPSFSLNFELIETTEQSDPTADPIKPGHKGNVLYMMDNEFGQGAFKKVAKPFAQALGVSSIRDIQSNITGMEVELVTKVRQNKDKTASYTDIVKVLI